MIRRVNHTPWPRYHALSSWVVFSCLLITTSPPPPYVCVRGNLWTLLGSQLGGNCGLSVCHMCGTTGCRLKELATLLPFFDSTWPWRGLKRWSMFLYSLWCCDKPLMCSSSLLYCSPCSPSATVMTTWCCHTVMTIARNVFWRHALWEPPKDRT